MTKTEEIIRACLENLAVLDEEDEEGRTLLGKTEEALNAVITHDDDHALLALCPRNEKGSFINSAELAGYRAVDVAGKSLVAASSAYQAFRDAMQATESALVSWLMIYSDE